MRLPRSAKAMDRPRHIEDLADELLNEVLSFLLETELWPHESIHTNNLDPPSEANGYGERRDLDRFRLVNKRFMRIGTPRKFSRFVLRFSRAGFQRLEHFLDMQLACYVRHFTYMVRPFYQGSGWSHILYGVGADHLPVSVLRSRLEDQRFLTDANHDLFLLRRALASFPSLQQVKLLRLQDGADEQLADYIWTQPLEFTVGFDWEPACTRAITTLSTALLESPCNPIRFIGPQISPSSTANLLQIQTPSTTLSTLGTRLKTLDLNFHPTTTMTSLTVTMQPLSTVFHAFFQSTTANLTSLHLGFPPKHPLALPLNHIIPNTIRWKHLRSLSLQGWCLGAEEINALARRHRMKLRDIRLRSVYLREDDGDGQAGKKWQDVLSVLREEMGVLEGIDLRDIDYSRHFLGNGHRNRNGNANGNGNGNHYFQNHHLLPSSSPSAAAEASEESIENTLSEQLRALTIDELGDDGISVKPGQHRLWEAWVLCSVSRAWNR